MNEDCRLDVLTCMLVSIWDICDWNMFHGTQDVGHEWTKRRVCSTFVANPRPSCNRHTERGLRRAGVGCECFTVLDCIHVLCREHGWTSLVVTIGNGQFTLLLLQTLAHIMLGDCGWVRHDMLQIGFIPQISMHKFN